MVSGAPIVSVQTWSVTFIASRKASAGGPSISLGVAVHTSVLQAAQASVEVAGGRLLIQLSICASSVALKKGPPGGMRGPEPAVPCSLRDSMLAAALPRATRSTPASRWLGWSITLSVQVAAPRSMPPAAPVPPLWQPVQPLLVSKVLTLPVAGSGSGAGPPPPAQAGVPQALHAAGFLRTRPFSARLRRPSSSRLCTVQIELPTLRGCVKCGAGPWVSTDAAALRNEPQFVSEPHGVRGGALLGSSNPPPDAPVRNSDEICPGSPPCSLANTAFSNLPSTGQARFQWVCGPVVENELLWHCMHSLLRCR
jgi:hypothetical protein